MFFISQQQRFSVEKNKSSEMLKCFLRCKSIVVGYRAASADTALAFLENEKKYGPQKIGIY